MKAILRKWFTLVEILISLIIIGFLIVTIFQTYEHVAKVSAKISGESAMQRELLYVMQVMQSVSDESTIKFPNIYPTTSTDEITFINKKNSNLESTFYSYWDWAPCPLYKIDSLINVNWPDFIDFNLPTSNCAIFMKKQDVTLPPAAPIQLTSFSKVYINDLQFTTIPRQRWFNAVLPLPAPAPTPAVNEIYSDGFWLTMDAVHPRYNPGQWAMNVHAELQTFFTSRQR